MDHFIAVYVQKFSAVRAPEIQVNFRAEMLTRPKGNNEHSSHLVCTQAMEGTEESVWSAEIRTANHQSLVSRVEKGATRQVQGSKFQLLVKMSGVRKTLHCNTIQTRCRTTSRHLQWVTRRDWLFRGKRLCCRATRLRCWQQEDIIQGSLRSAQCESSRWRKRS